MKQIYFTLMSLICAVIFSQPSFSQTTFNYTGNMQTYVVPAGVTTIQIEVWGAQGGNATFGSTSGGLGGYAVGELSVTPGETLNIFVGGQDGYNGGGIGGLQGNASTINGPSPFSGPSGGGASDVRQGGTTLNDRVIVGGGGGGAGNDGNWNSCQPSPGVDGGVGGGLTGGTGPTASNSFACNCAGGGGEGGTGGSQIAGGTAGNYQGGCFSGNWNLGQDGGFGYGGDGDQTAPYAGDGAAGGGGGGYYGGGAGGDGVNTTSGGGGGGGSSYIGGVTNASETAGMQTGHGQVVITLQCDPLLTTVSADTVCLGDSVILHASSNNGGTISWDNGISDSVAFEPALGATTYTATSTDGNDCVFDQLIYVHALPTVSGGSDIVLCTATDTVLTGSGADSYVWDNGVTDGVSFSPPNGNTNYIVVGTDANGCEDMDTVLISVGGPQLTAVITHENLGADGAIDLSVSGGSGSYTYSWSNGPFTQDISNLVANTYTVVVDDGICTSDSSFTVLNVAGITTNSQNGIRVYPNPTSGLVMIEMEGEFNYILQNVLGQTLASEKVLGSLELDLSQFENGIYLISISNGISKETIRIVKH